MKQLDFNTAFKYPFNRAVGMLNFLWILLPIIGWFALGGYGVRIIKEFTRGKFKELPAFDFNNDIKLGFMMFLKAIPFALVCLVIALILKEIGPRAYGLGQVLLGLFVYPILTINFFNKETVASLFEVRILKSVFNNMGDYLMVVLKSIVLGIIFLVMWIILVGIPAGSFTKNIFIADFYRRKVK